ncbi:thiolase family protein [Paenarthrobacter sp. PH39-S1]|uniref:thiolase family protein n=1 Tax=Paenarthrobacter sp. PH39-S1 TaxID=3046204 RepID=UPI0024BBCDE1|nr:thiolase family protein [Paenarthrobacter sp. PH39-S1]MDJ0356711.1 thiolase family protein [Paenarthrobacter sp. PH39-S1]
MRGDNQPVVIAARRTPIGRAGGAYRDVPAHDLLAPVLQALLADGRLPGNGVADVIIGNATGGGGNIARLAALTAGLPVDVPGLTVDRQCGSGLEAVVLASRLVAAGAGRAYLAGGVESISTAPARAHRLPDGSLEFFDRAQFAPPWLGDTDVGVAAENVAGRYGISRERQDEYALRSHRLALAAQDAGEFTAELVPFSQLAADQGPRRTLTAAMLARFPAAFVPGGTVTAGNSCPFSDGAAAVLVTSRARARELGAQAGLVFLDSAVTGNEPAYLGAGAESSTRELLRRSGSSLDAVPLIEFNEAFASQVLAVLDRLELDPGRINAGGGALALGHPYGASGAVSVTRLFTQARRRAGSHGPEGELALAMISIAGGMGISALFRWETL